MPTKTADSPTYIATIENFRTLAQKTQDELLDPQVGREAYNLRFDETYGSLVKRLNRAKYASMASLGTSRVIGAYRYYKNSDDTKYQIVAYSTFLKLGSDTAGTFSNIKTGLTADLRWTWITYKDLCYGFNGTDNNIVFDGTNCEDMGVPIPTAPSGVDSGVAGNPNGAYKYKVTYLIDSYQEGSSSVASATVTTTGAKQITVTIPVSSNTRVTHRYLYRTAASGSIYYFCAQIANNADLTYTDNIADASLDTTIIAPTDYGAPGAYQLSCLHKSRIFLARNSTFKSRTIYSDVRSGTSYPDVYPALNYFDILRDNGEEITFIGEDNYGQLIEMKPSAVVKINTDTDDPVGWSGFNDIISPNGCVAPYSAVKTHIGIIYVSRYGEQRKRLMVWNGSSTQPIFEELEPILSGILDTRLTDIVAVYHNGVYQLSYTDTSVGDTFNNRVLLIDLLNNSWVIDKKNVDCFCVWNSGTDWGELHTGTSDATGFLYRENTDLEDLVIRYKSDLDKGTFDSACQSGGTEDVPVVTMIKSELDTEIGATVVSAAGGTVSGYNDVSINETVSPSCTYISPILEVSAKNLVLLYWTVTHGIGGRSRFWIRTADTMAAIVLASWSGPYSTPSGSDISSVSAAKYIQYMAKLYVENTANWAGIYFYRSTSAFPNDYVVKISFGFGSQAETAIPMEYISHWDDFGWINTSFKRVRKRMRAVKIYFDRTAQSGDLVFGYYLNGSTIRTDVTFSLSAYASQGYILYNFPLGKYFNNFKYRLYQNDADKITIKRVSFIISPEPYVPFY
jgi:hypothetical protein